MAEAPATIEIPKDNRDLVLGQVVGALNSLIDSNKEDHAKIFKRLEEGDQYFAVFKFSRCAFSWLGGISALKGAGIVLGLLLADLATHYLYSVIR